MTSGRVNIILANGQLGATLQTNDGIVGMVLTGADESGGYTTGTPILVTSMNDVANAGITIGNNPFALKQLQEFYNQAGAGAQLYLMLTPATMTVADMADNTNANSAKALLDYAAGKIKVLGLLSDDVAIAAAGGTITITNGMNADVYTAADNMADMANAYFHAEQPFRAVIGATSLSGASGVVSTPAVDGGVAGDIYYRKNFLNNTLQLRAFLGSSNAQNFATVSTIQQYVLGVLPERYIPLSSRVYFTGEIKFLFTSRFKDDLGVGWLERIVCSLDTTGNVSAYFVKPDIAIANYTVEFDVILPLD